MLQSLLSQLALSTDGLSISESITSARENRQEKHLNAQECTDLLGGIIRQFRQTTLIIDALDECEEADALLLHREELLAAAGGHIFDSHYLLNVVIFSRHEVVLPNSILQPQIVVLEQHRDHTMQDMEKYIKTQVRDREDLKLGYRLLRGEYPNLEKRLIDILVRQAQGM